MLRVRNKHRRITLSWDGLNKPIDAGEVVDLDAIFPGSDKKAMVKLWIGPAAKFEHDLELVDELPVDEPVIEVKESEPKTVHKYVSVIVPSDSPPIEVKKVEVKRRKK